MSDTIKPTIDYPSVDIDVNFCHEQLDLCKKCYAEICDICKTFSEENDAVYEVNPVTNYCDGCYFTVYICTKHMELINRVINKLNEYSK